MLLVFFLAAHEHSHGHSSPLNASSGADHDEIHSHEGHPLTGDKHNYALGK